ncbi:MAG: NAD-glutamate dehydrogenase [Pseudomonadales bacterium]|nr:NAD-glutamate dehydrogenase [Pseudomonadales bacterium]
MTDIKVDSKAAFQAGLERRLAKRDRAHALKIFSRQYFSQVPLAEVLQKDWEYAEGTLLSSWRFFTSFDGRKSAVRVFNPQQERDGYEHKQTVIEVACVNLPFLLDSLRIELNRQQVGLSDVQQCLMRVVREEGKLVISENDDPNETLIHLEVDRVKNLARLERDIRDVLKHVQRVVDDFAPMRKELLLWSDEIGIAASRSQELGEAYEFLRWLYSNNYTFLAFEAFRQDDKGEYRVIPGSSLGLARKNFYVSGQPLGPLTDVINVEKSPQKSRVHRPAYFDCVTIRFGDRLCRFMGLFTSSVYNQNPMDLPIVRKKIEHVFDTAGLASASHTGRELSRIIEVLPREELFLATDEELSDMVSRIYGLQERRIVRVLVRRDLNRHFVNCLVYVPKDTYDTELRLRVQDLLVDTFGAMDAEFATFFSESALTRTHFLLRVDPASDESVDVEFLEREVAELTRSWDDDLHEVIVAALGNGRGEQVFETVRNVFPAGYKDDYWPSTAFGDIEYLLALSEDNPLLVNLYQWVVLGQPETRFKVYRFGDIIPLSDVIPILENLGAKTVEEHPYELKLGGKRIWVYDFVLDLVVEPRGGMEALRAHFEEAFRQIWSGGKENDGFNRLVPSAGMDYREASLIRAYSRYFGQLQSTSSQSFIADCVVRYSEITRLLFDLFDCRFNPGRNREAADKKAESLKTEILAMIDAVENLSEDRILRRYVEMISATQRTNFYQLTAEDRPKDYISFKVLPALISEMPLPKPRYEIFVYSPRVEGVHLRGGKIARGGLRWSDRTEDYRTEILGLVKAQQVKNSVIVPVGAKGGFLPKQMPEGAGRDAIQEEGIACYRIFIQGLLDLTDNLVKGKVVPPRDVIRYDDDDYYLVVAADKGTATFSDIANEISASNGFWLGDAFASGGSVGYDHKAMGITARGAWKSVEQHFRDLGIDVQTTPFTVVGIGDMAGDVFGNGMLLSKQICLVAAFNHLHIFIDPNPDPASSFKERKRLFDTPRSSWSDYNAKLISKGGGVFNRAAKSIPITPEMRKRFGISESSLTPTRLINALLKAEVDLLWNGGIGTYVKSQRESHLDVGDKANDALRVNGADLRCRVVGEGGNLGMTQLARVEYNLKGGICFTDFIDNAGGVNCSDAEVNIKILLNQLVEKGRLTAEERKALLRRMTDEVAEIVLDNNYMQAQAINLMCYQSTRRAFEYSRLMNLLASSGRLDRQLEYLPGDEELQERAAMGKSFTAPELSVLTSYVKGGLKEELAGAKLLDEPWMMKEMEVAFPPYLVKRYHDDLANHRLRREIVATQIANGMVNRMGISFANRMAESTGMDTALIAKAYLGSRDIFDMEARWDEIQALDYKVKPEVQKEMILDLVRLIRRTTRWLLRNRRHALHLEREVPAFRKALGLLLSRWDKVLCGSVLTDWEETRARLIAEGVGESLAGFVAAAHHLYATVGIVEASNRTGETTLRAASIYFAVGERLHLHWFSRQMHEFQATGQWEALARETLQDDLNWQQVAITLGVITEGKKRGSIDTMIDNWMTKHQRLVDRWMSLEAEMRASGVREPAIFTVAIRELLDLAQSSSGARARF